MDSTPAPHLPAPGPGRDWKAPWVDDLDRVSARDRWGRALMAVGWVHLISFVGCQAMHSAGDRRGWHYVAAWGLEFGCVLLVLRQLAGRGWHRATPLGGLVVRVWGTFLILSFNLASLNSLSGLEHEWFKPALATLSAFGFMIMAYLISVRFFLLAVQMYFTGLLMVTHLDLCYLIYGLSWWLALQAIGLELERRRARSPAPGSVRGEPHRLRRGSSAAVD